MKNKCKFCGKEFEAVTFWQRYDTEACRQADYRKRVKEKQEQEERKKQTKTSPAK